MDRTIKYFLYSYRSFLSLCFSFARFTLDFEEILPNFIMALVNNLLANIAKGKICTVTDPPPLLVTEKSEPDY